MPGNTPGHNPCGTADLPQSVETQLETGAAEARGAGLSALSTGAERAAPPAWEPFGTGGEGGKEPTHPAPKLLQPAAPGGPDSPGHSQHVATRRPPVKLPTQRLRRLPRNQMSRAWKTLL